MPKVSMAVIAACLVGALLQGCSRSELPPVDFTPTKAAAESANPQAALRAAQEACEAEARRKGIASVTAIVLRRGKISKSDYVACMKRYGYEVSGEAGQ